MLNIISRSLISDSTSGPKKVVENLIKGLDRIGYPYVINKRLDSCKRLWIHDDINALWMLKSLSDSIKPIIGPNLFIRPRNIPSDLDISKAVFICPSKWATSFWTDFGFNSCVTDCWPTGIDTEQYKPSTIKKDIVLLYFKQRNIDELQKVEHVLKSKNILYEVISYGSYKENEYRRLLAKSKYIIWLGRHETQGIALEEALATNIPMIVCEVTTLGHWAPSNKEKTFFNEEDNAYTKARVAEYFDNRCGIKINKLESLSEAIEIMEKNINTFSPRAYILENLSLEKQARDFIYLYEKYYGLSYADGLTEKLQKNGNWINASFRYIIYFKIRKLLKKILTNH